MTRVEQTAAAFLVTSLERRRSTRFSLFNSTEKNRFRAALAYLKREEHVLPKITPDCASQEWCADFAAGGCVVSIRRAGVRQFLFAVLEPPGKDAGAGANSDHRNLPRTELAPNEDRKMRLIYRSFFNVRDRINYVSEAQRTMWESRGIRHALGRCDRQRVHEHFSFASLLRNYESLLEETTHRRRARGA
jgi:hypothetical protein